MQNLEHGVIVDESRMRFGTESSHLRPCLPVLWRDPRLDLRQSLSHPRRDPCPDRRQRDVQLSGIR